MKIETGFYSDVTVGVAGKEMAEIAAPYLTKFRQSPC